MPCTSEQCRIPSPEKQAQLIDPRLADVIARSTGAACAIFTNIHERAYRFEESTCGWLDNPLFSLSPYDGAEMVVKQSSKRRACDDIAFVAMILCRGSLSFF